MATNDRSLGLGSSIPLGEAEFNQLSDFIYREYGIKMPPAKRIMLQSRLQRRLKELGIPNFKEYCKHVFSKPGADEVIHMMDVVSTNKTDFFREPAHFDYLRDHLLPEFSARERRVMKIWSAGCSSGEEAYTIAMTISEYNERNTPVAFQILGTDISTKVLTKAKEGYYDDSRVAALPATIRQKYFEKCPPPRQGQVRVSQQLRAAARFGRLNLMDVSYPLQTLVDVIFCRNTMIYFERDTQEDVINKLCRHLRPDGFLFIGHSESIVNMHVPLRHVRPTIYRKT